MDEIDLYDWSDDDEREYTLFFGLFMRAARGDLDDERVDPERVPAGATLH
jgi:hypothetical protein